MGSPRRAEAARTDLGDNPRSTAGLSRADPSGPSASPTTIAARLRSVGAAEEGVMRVLFASPCAPRPLVDGRDPLDPFAGQLSPSQGPYAMSVHAHYWAFYLMAENLRAESCVLEHPTRAEFEAELRKGYGLGLQVNWNALGDTAEMVARARAIAPRTKIVVGGYALAQILDPLPPDREMAAAIREEADHLCAVEGVAFMRRLLGDRPAARPIMQYTLPSLGCPAGCEFCATSAFFQRQKTQVAEPAEIHGFMRHRLREAEGARAHFELFDEDFTEHPAPPSSEVKPATRWTSYRPGAPPQVRRRAA